MATTPMRLVALLLFFLTGLSPAVAFETGLHHRLSVHLAPERQLLTAEDRIQLSAAGARALTFVLSPRAAVTAVRVDGRPLPVDFNGGRLRVPLAGAAAGGPLEVAIHYTAVFDDPVPVLPANTDNPGYGVSGSISPDGTFLLAGAGWYPRLPGRADTFELTVNAPAGTLAVTAGRDLGVETREGRSLSRWQIDQPLEGLALSAGPYRVERRTAGGLNAAVYLFAPNLDLADAYLSASLEFMAFYQERFGPYPFPQFAVVENFFPTGYGFPGYTLMGGQVLRLPFIIATSLGHEIAHCWWGNGVYVDPRGGNWSEGLTTYVADYYYKELQGPEAAREYRRELLRSYATLARPDREFALSDFTQRVDPLSKTVGYDKGALVFHMLRGQVGDAVFSRSLRDFYQTYRFRRAGWDDLRTVFEKHSGGALGAFFDQWVRRAGGPQLALANVTLTPAQNGYRVAGVLSQTPPYYRLDVPLTVFTATDHTTRRLTVTGRTAPFSVYVPEPPLRLVADPDFDLFRRLSAEEIPPTVNTLKAAQQPLVVLPDAAAPELAAAANLLVSSLGLQKPRLVRSAALNPDLWRDRSVLWVGAAPADGLLAGRPPDLALAPGEFAVAGRRYAGPADSLFAVWPHPPAAAAVGAVFLPLAQRNALLVARKITHYGKYSYLVFTDGANQAKGTWPAARSPVVHAWP
ncbi:MAG: M1 family aminopeptidase [Desulfobacterales bacterium]